MLDSFDSLSTLTVDGRSHRIHRLTNLRGFDTERLPFSIRILLENLLRTEDGRSVTGDDIQALARWRPQAEPEREIAFTPSRVLLQDFTGVPAVVDLAAMRQAMKAFGGDPRRIDPLQPVELVIDHSVQVDDFGSRRSLLRNAELELERNGERYRFLKWGQTAFHNLRVVPPDVGIVHQVNLEYLARLVVAEAPGPGGPPMAFPDTVVGTDSHTTMINGLGVLGWGVGGIEAEAAMLGQPVSMLVPQVIGVRLHGALREGTTATDLVLTVTQILRQRGVVGRFVEFHGPGLASLPLADRATIANMAPEYGATCGIFPVDAETLRYLRLSGRPEEHVRLVEAYCKEQGLFHTESTPPAEYTDVVELDLGTVEGSLAGPSRPQDRVALRDVKASFLRSLEGLRVHPREGAGAARGAELDDGSVVIAAITSCTNTSNPSVLMAAGLLAKKAVERGLSTRPWVKTSLAPGSRVVSDYLAHAGLLPYLEALGFFLVGYGCTTCIGNSGPLPPEVSREIADKGLVVAAVLSGNRNFEGRIHPDVRANYLASPPLVVAYALAGRVDLDLATEPLGPGKDGRPVFLADIWPSRQEIEQAVEAHVHSSMFGQVYSSVFDGDPSWTSLAVPLGDLYAWEDASTYVKLPPYFRDMPRAPAKVAPLQAARVLALLGDSITTDHISPAGSIKKDSPAGRYLLEHGVQQKDFNSYGARRGNHEVMVRGTFGNARLRNRLVPGTEGGLTRHLPDGEQMTIYDAAMRYQAEGVPLLVIAGKDYGAGSSRDWAAKGPRLLGVRAVVAESFERIHRSNLVGMGVLPLQFAPGESAATLGLTGEEVYAVEGLAELVEGAWGTRGRLTVTATPPEGAARAFDAVVRIDTAHEAEYFRHGGILPYVLRGLLSTV